MADILKILLIVLGILIVYVSYWLLAEALFPALVEQASRHYRKPVRITMVGLAAAVLPVILGLLLARTPNPLTKLLGMTLLIVPALLGLVGSAGLTLRIGEGLPAPIDEAQPWRRVLRGGVLLACSFLLPVVGWVVLPLWVLVSGFGAFILCVAEKRREQPTQPSESLMPAN
ncbi:MAG: hypothetical protein ACREIC_17795 [Limisphaerales bacterium]